MTSLTKCQEQFKYRYKNIRFLETALTHRSYLNENRAILESNERLEFLGDAVLELIVSEFLYLKFPKLPEGRLTAYRSKIVQTRTLAAVANNLNLGECLLLSRGEAASGGRQNSSILADLVEAIIGSLYLDGGINAAFSFVKAQLLENYQDLIKSEDVEDWKSKLQEVVQAKGGIAPTYEVIDETGPDHSRIFTVGVNFFDKLQTTGTGKSKQAAQQVAARKALENLGSLE
jgi:ribonuclease III